MIAGGREAVDFALSVLETEKSYYKREMNLNFSGRVEAFDPKVHALWTCSYDHFNDPRRIFDALTAQAAQRNVLVLGDSVGRDTAHALRLAYPDTNFIMLHQSCCPPGHYRNPNRDRGCFEGLAGMLDRIQKCLTIDAIIMAYRYRPVDWARIEPTLPIVRDMTDHALMLGVSPVFSKPIATFLRDAGRVPMHIDRYDPAMLPWDIDDIAYQAQDMADAHGVKFVDVRNFYCTEDRYPLWVDGRIDRPVFWDEVHLTRYGVEQFSYYLARQPELACLAGSFGVTSERVERVI